MKSHLERRPAFTPHRRSWSSLGKTRRWTGAWLDVSSVWYPGRTARFQSPLDELVTFMAEVLREVEKTTRRTC